MQMQIYNIDRHLLTIGNVKALDKTQENEY